MTKKEVLCSVSAWLILGTAFAIVQNHAIVQDHKYDWPVSFALGVLSAVSLELYAWGKR